MPERCPICNYSPRRRRLLLTLQHFALRTAGVLFLGASESLGTAQVLFEPVLTEKFRIFRRSHDGRLARAWDFPWRNVGRTAVVPGRLAPPGWDGASHRCRNWSSA